MAIELTTAALIRAGSGVLFVSLGCAVLALARRRAENVAFGAWAFAFGFAFLVSNLLVGDDASVLALVWVRAVSFGAAGLLLVACAALGFPGGERPSRAALALALACGGVQLSLGFLGDAGAATTLGAYFPWLPGPAQVANRAGVYLLTGGSVVIIVTLAARAFASPRAAPALFVAAAAFALQGAYSRGSAAIGGEPLAWAPLAFFLVAVVGSWIVAASRAGRPAWAVSLVLLAGALAGMIDGVWFGGPFIGSPSPGPGLVRTVAVGIFAWAILRHRLLGFDLAVPLERRGRVATIGLVTFFVVAQVAQSWLSDAMGVVLGGAAAGALLFAAAPLQRAAERLAESASATRAAKGGDEGKEEAFRGAVRLAWRDRALTGEEELALARLADELGLRHARVRELRDEVEAARPRDAGK